ncbi:MAG TPA: FAD-binding domain-containing protein [Acidocella sp.]|nr:FAD-binding domain-containing protein [Acidocella sp.]HQU03917.1 FAD-binding domain-containing protein [Acidocella sp.]
MVQLVWFKRDLRTADHRPLAEAAASGPVIPLYVAEPEYWALPDTSRRQYLAVRSALEALSLRLEQLGAPLIIRIGSVVEQLSRIHRAVGLTRILAHQETGNAWTFARDRAVRRFCRDAGIAFVEYPQFGVVRGLRNRDEWGARSAAILRAPPLPEPACLIAATRAPAGEIPTPEQLGLPEDVCGQPQPGTRQSALALLNSFFAGRGAHYRRAMSNPLAGADACSRLSVPLATGAISIREALAACYAARNKPAAVPRTAIDSLISRLHWHCHFIQKLESEPQMEHHSVHPAHERARVLTAADDPTLLAWATGRSGYPFADACMRSLIATGWLNFRMRAMLMSFAVHHLGLDWRACGLHLARLFTDYEPGIHWPQVQMQSGQTGINTPRIYNPVKQGLDQDPTGAFTRRWVPELAELPLALLQTPWLAEAGQPAPVVDPHHAIRDARARLSQVRAEPGYRTASEAVFRKHGSRTRRLEDDHPQRQRAIKKEKTTMAKRQLALEF